MITDIVIFPNGMVAVFDQFGEQICMLQGRYSKRKRILLYLITAYPKIKVTGNILQKKQEWEITKDNYYLPYLMSGLYN